MSQPSGRGNGAALLTSPDVLAAVPSPRAAPSADAGPSPSFDSSRPPTSTAAGLPAEAADLSEKATWTNEAAAGGLADEKGTGDDTLVAGLDELPNAPHFPDGGAQAYLAALGGQSQVFRYSVVHQVRYNGERSPSRASSAPHFSQMPAPYCTRCRLS